MDTDEGIFGVGESGLTGREEAVIGGISHFKDLLVGQDPFRIEHIWQVMFRGGFFPAQRVLSSAMSAIDIALWDIKGKALGVPVYELLGGRVRDKVVCYPHNHTDALEAGPLVESCLETKEQGWKFVRWGLPQDGAILEPRDSVRAALRQFEAVRAAVGDEIGICFDVHTRLDLPDVIWLCREVEQYAPFFIEDPLRSENPDSFKTLRAAHARASGRGRTVLFQMGVSPADRGGVDRLRARRHVHRRRLHRGAQDRRLVRDALHQAGCSQPARAGLLGSLPADEHGDAQLRGYRSSRASLAKPCPRSCPSIPTGKDGYMTPTRPARPRHRVRQGGSRAQSLPQTGDAERTAQRWLLHQLVSTPGQQRRSASEA